jgi:hypothetical protein
VLLLSCALRTLRSMISMGRSNSWTMHRGMAPPQGCKKNQVQQQQAVEQGRLVSVAL